MEFCVCDAGLFKSHRRCDLYDDRKHDHDVDRQSPAGILIAKYFHLGIYGVWLAHTVIDWIIRTIFFLTRYKNGKWKTKAIKQ